MSARRGLRTDLPSKKNRKLVDKKRGKLPFWFIKISENKSSKHCKLRGLNHAKRLWSVCLRAIECAVRKNT